MTHIFPRQTLFPCTPCICLKNKYIWESPRLITYCAWYSAALQYTMLHNNLHSESIWKKKKKTKKKRRFPVVPSVMQSLFLYLIMCTKFYARSQNICKAVDLKSSYNSQTDRFHTQFEVSEIVCGANSSIGVSSDNTPPVCLVRKWRTNVLNNQIATHIWNTK